MKGTVRWLPHFDPSSFESSDAKERKAMHEQALYDIWNLLGATTMEEAEEIRGNLLDNKPGDHKRSTVAEAMKVVAERLERRQQSARSRRAKKARVGGAAGDAKDSDGDDESGYESATDEEELQQARQDAFGRRLQRESMPPPGRSSLRGQGRQSVTARSNRTRSSSNDHTMSGGFGGRATTESEAEFERDPIGGSPPPASRRSMSHAGRDERGRFKRGREVSVESGRRVEPRLESSIFELPTPGPSGVPRTSQERVNGNGGRREQRLDAEGFGVEDMEEVFQENARHNSRQPSRAPDGEE